MVETLLVVIYRPGLSRYADPAPNAPGRNRVLGIKAPGVEEQKLSETV
jgi:hypothetical protein